MRRESGAPRVASGFTGQGRAALKVLAYETMRDIARRMWDKPPFLLGGAQAQHGAVGSEVLIRDIPGLSGIRPGNPILAGATSFARGSDQKERVACESCVQGTVCRNRFRSPSSPTISGIPAATLPRLPLIPGLSRVSKLLIEVSRPGGARHEKCVRMAAGGSRGTRIPRVRLTGSR